MITENLGQRSIQRAFLTCACCACFFFISCGGGGAPKPTVIVSKVLKAKEKNYGYDANKGEFTDLRKAGIVDPVKVTRSAVANAASIAGLLLTTESLVVEKPKAAEPEAAGGHGHGHSHGPGF